MSNIAQAALTKIGAREAEPAFQTGDDIYLSKHTDEQFEIMRTALQSITNAPVQGALPPFSIAQSALDRVK